MFEQLVKEHTLRERLRDGAFHPFPPMDDRAAWGQVARAEITALAEKYRAIAYPMRRATDFMAFVRSGSRKADENPYFLRRRKLCIAALNCCVTGELQDLDDVVDGLWCICEESSWVISAHNSNPLSMKDRPAEYPLPDPEHPYVDLFSAQTAMILSLVCSLMPTQLDAVAPMIRRRVEREIRKRVLDPFMQHDHFTWMGFVCKNLNNWTPWIVSNVQLTAAVWMKDQAELTQLLERSLPMIDRWLVCVPEDGGCDEGAGYWNMAGGALLDSLDLLEKLTDGSVTFWQDAKLRNILQFPAKVSMGGGWFINFADCDARPLLDGERLQLAGEKIGDQELTALGVSLRGNVEKQFSDTPQMWRVLNLLFHPACATPYAPQTKDVWLPELQLRIREDQGFSLACKGGHNDESHNHNDVGSFMLYVDGEPTLVDAGNMVYTAKTFSAERYTLWNTRSCYHNLPIIGGQEQQPGRMHAAGDVQPTDDGMKLDMSPAYDENAGILTAQRSLNVQAGMLDVADHVALKQPEAVTWVFMLRHKPQLQMGSAVTNTVQMTFDPDLKASVEEIRVEDPRMAGSFPGSLWRLMLTAEPAVQHTQQFRVARR